MTQIAPQEQIVHNIFTIQEGVTLGGSYSCELIVNPLDFYTPRVIVDMKRTRELLAGSLDQTHHSNKLKNLILADKDKEVQTRLKEIIKQRQKLGFYLNPHAASIIGIDGRLAISFEPLDPRTGATSTDPKVLGIWDEESKIITYQERAEELTSRYFEALREIHQRIPEEQAGDFRLRDYPNYLEVQINPFKEKK